MDMIEPPDELGNWMTQLRKGLLELCIFNLLSRGELYGYDLVKQLSRIPGLVITEGTVYPLLSRLRKGGLLDTRLVESASGPARRYYRLTPEGERVLRLMNHYWRDLAKAVDGCVQGGNDHA